MCHHYHVVTTVVAPSLCLCAGRGLGAFFILFTVCFSKDADDFVLGTITLLRIIFCPVVSTSLCPLPSLRGSCSGHLVFSCFLAVAYAFIVLWWWCFDPQFVFLASIFLFPSLCCFIISALKSCFLKFITFLNFLLELSQWSSFLGLFSVAGCFSSLPSPYRVSCSSSSHAVSLHLVYIAREELHPYLYALPRDPDRRGLGLGVGKSLCWAPHSSGWRICVLPRRSGDFVK